MATEGYKRKLSAIFSADVVGYGRLMEEDETATVRTLEAYRDTIAIIIKQHRGRIIDSVGDNILSEFASVVDAVQSAVEIQLVIKAKNADLPENRKMEFRVGINLGDVIEEGDRIYGDGVNLAARIETMADPGSICISGSAYEQIKSKLALGYEDLGERTVKNISTPVRVYRIPMDSRAVSGAGITKRGLARFRWVALLLAGLVIGIGVISTWNHFSETLTRSYVATPETAFTKEAETSLTGQPSIVVLPFENMSGDPEQEYFVAGMVEEIVTKLSMNSALPMIAGNPLFFYKGKQTKRQQIADELGARYIVSGSVRKAEDQVRITAQLIDAISGNHIWAKTYDRELRDVFSLQDDVSQQIVAALNLKYAEAEQARVRRIPTDSLTAYGAFQRGASHSFRYTREGSAQARKMFQRAIALDPEYALAHASLGNTHLLDYTFKFSQGPQALEQAIMHLKKAISLDDSLSIAHATVANAYRMKGQIELAMAEVGRAISLNPYDAEGHYMLGAIHNTLGESEDALEAIQKAMQLNPYYPGRYLIGLARAYRDLGKDEEAIRALNEAVARDPDYTLIHSELAALRKAGL
ncbi:MAG: tetratricopeptide repeat protein [Desulfobacterales bacterium]